MANKTTSTSSFPLSNLFHNLETHRSVLSLCSNSAMNTSVYVLWWDETWVHTFVLIWLSVMCNTALTIHCVCKWKKRNKVECYLNTSTMVDGKWVTQVRLYSKCVPQNIYILASSLSALHNASGTCKQWCSTVFFNLFSKQISLMFSICLIYAQQPIYKLVAFILFLQLYHETLDFPF